MDAKILIFPYKYLISGIFFCNLYNVEIDRKEISIIHYIISRVFLR
jgi:hypothetical protein